MYHLDAHTFGCAPVAVVHTLIAALQRRCGRLEHDVPYPHWREAVQIAGGAAEAALTVLPAPTASAGTATLRLPRASRPGLERTRGRSLVVGRAVGQPGIASDREDATGGTTHDEDISGGRNAKGQSS